MKFIITYAIKSKTQERNESIARFLKAGGNIPAGAKLLGRWTKLDFSGGFVLIESADPKPLLEFSLAWSDLMELSIVPVMEDQELAGVLQGRARKKK